MRTELDVPFSHKDQAKALGAKWDRVKKIWYVPDGVNPEPFAAWLPGVDRSDPSAPYIYLVLGKRECWKCHEQTTVAAFGIPYRVAEDSGSKAAPGAAPATTKTVSLATTCTACGALQGSHYLFEEPMSPFALTAINKLPALEFVRVEVAGVFGIHARQGNFDQALFTWARDHHTQFHKPLCEGIYL